MSSPQRYAIAWFILLSMLAAWLQIGPMPSIHGIVVDADGPVVNAQVGWQGGRLRVRTDARGRFALPASASNRRVVAIKSGHRIGSHLATGNPFTLTLAPLPGADHEDYAWIDPHPDPKSVNNCANCHADIYREWSRSAHAQSATNAKFLQLFAGTDRKSPAQKTWNARAEHPDGSAVCASCHVPTLASPALDYDVRAATGVATSGIHCDYCHKVAEVPDGKFGLRFGRDALHLLRPSKDDPLTFGPLDDAVRQGESFAYAPIYKDSRYCASCHEGVVFGVHAYGTYSEWLESPAKQSGQQCQDCHMAPTGRMTNIAPGKGGIQRDPRTLASHHTPGGQPEMLKKCLTVQVRAKNPGQVEIEVAAQNVGHRVPTGFPDRQVIMVVEAFDANGERAPMLDGPRLPASVGKWKGLPGRLYAKQLVGEAERTPVPFWLPIFKTNDTRLVPDQIDRQTFRFPASAQRVRVQLWYRRFWQEVADSRGWTDNDELIHETEEPRSK